MQINGADETGPAKLYKTQMFRRLSAEHKQGRKEKARRPGEAFALRVKNKKKNKLREANGFVLHLAVCASAEASGAQIDFFFFILFFERSMIYSPCKPKSLALTLSCDGESFG